MAPEPTFEQALNTAIGTFGAAVTPRLESPVGEPEDQLRGPLENLIDSVGGSLGLRVEKFGEASLAALRVRPDYAIQVDGAITGYLEVKAPGKGAAVTSFRGHDRAQWLNLKELPNVLYTDGNAWALYRSGVLVGEVAVLQGDVRTSGATLRPADGALATLLHAFLHWQPIPPASVDALVGSVAGMCRLLRAEILDALAREEVDAGPAPLTAIASDWRTLLFPEATDAQFADGYAQTVTFGLLLARVEQIDFTNRSVVEIARRLGRQHSLMGRALSVLTEDSVGDIRVTIDTMLRVIGAVDWQALDKNQDTLLHLYEHFLAIYDPVLRKKTGSYYTPNPVVAGMVRLTAESLRVDLGIADDFLSESVVIADPAMGTGTFLLNIVSNAARKVDEEEGLGAVGPRLEKLAPRLIGFEKQVGPYAVAELRAYEAFRRENASIPSDSLRLYVADTLDNPYIEEVHLGAGYEPIAKSRRSANAIKKDEWVMVVIGNPPYAAQAGGQGGWVESGDVSASQRALLEDFTPETADDVGPHVRHIYNQYVYFWRWATWKVFEAQGDDKPGVVCFITSSGWLNGPGFVAMRRYLLDQCDDLWVVDLEGGGLNTPRTENVFDIQTPVAVVIAVRAGGIKPEQARARYTKISGPRADKLAVMGRIESRNELTWVDVKHPVLSLLPRDVVWAEFPVVHDVFPWFGVGVTAGRTWVMGPDQDVLMERFKTLITAPAAQKNALLVPHETDRRIDTVVRSLPGFRDNGGVSLEKEDSPVTEVVRLGRRSFDRQWIIADNRVLNRPNPKFWESHSEQQVYMATNKAHPIAQGPALTFSAYPVDNGYFRAAGGEYALPLWRDHDATVPNVSPGLIDFLAHEYGIPVTGQDVFAYAAGIAAHPSYYQTFRAELTEPGVRIPITQDGDLWREVVAMGRKIINLHTFGERFSEAGGNRGCPKLPTGRRPKVVTAISSAEGSLPEAITYDASTEVLSVGTGRISPVPATVWSYQVSGMSVILHWFGYRKKSPTGRRSSSLDRIQPTRWPASYTTELLEILNVLGLLVECELDQEALLARVIAGACFRVSDALGGMIPPASNVRRPVHRATDGMLL